MDWSFLNLFKKADFNTLMFSAGLTCWILLSIYPLNIYILAVAFLSSIYCIARVAVYLFNYYQTKKTKRANKLYNKQQEEKKIRERNLQAQYVYDRLSEENKKLFSEIVKKGFKSSYSDVYILKELNIYSPIISRLRAVLQGDNMIESWVSIEETTDSVIIYVKYPLNEIFESNSK